MSPAEGIPDIHAGAGAPSIGRNGYQAMPGECEGGMMPGDGEGETSDGEVEEDVSDREGDGESLLGKGNGESSLGEGDEESLLGEGVDHWDTGDGDDGVGLDVLEEVSEDAGAMEMSAQFQNLCGEGEAYTLATACWKMEAQADEQAPGLRIGTERFPCTPATNQAQAHRLPLQGRRRRRPDSPAARDWHSWGRCWGGHMYCLQGAARGGRSTAIATTVLPPHGVPQSIPGTTECPRISRGAPVR